MILQEDIKLAKRENTRRFRSKRLESGLCITCGITNSAKTKMCVKCIEKSRLKNRNLKDVVFAAYGGYTCKCCGEKTPEFLTIDHIDNNGAEHRRKIGKKNFYNWLRRESFPSGFQVLCWNCNLAKRFGNTCPHQKLPTETFGDSSLMLWL